MISETNAYLAKLPRDYFLDALKKLKAGSTV